VCKPLATDIDAEVSTTMKTPTRLTDSYSLMWNLPVRAVTRQSIALTESP